MISYNEIIEILNSAEKQISDCLAYLRDNKNTIIFKDYEDNYYNHLNNQYADVNRRTFLLKDVDFNSFFDIPFPARIKEDLGSNEIFASFIAFSASGQLITLIEQSCNLFR